MQSFTDLFNHSASRQAHEDIYGQEPRHQSSWTHEIISGAAGFAGNIYFILKINHKYFYLCSYESL